MGALDGPIEAGTAMPEEPPDRLPTPDPTSPEGTEPATRVRIGSGGIHVGRRLVGPLEGAVTGRPDGRGQRGEVGRDVGVALLAVGGQARCTTASTSSGSPPPIGAAAAPGRRRP